MNEETLQIIIPIVTGTAGIILKSGYDAYKTKNNKKEKALIMEQLYSDLEKMYSKDLLLQKKLHEKSVENEELKQIINKLENAGSNRP